MDGCCCFREDDGQVLTSGWTTRPFGTVDSRAFISDLEGDWGVNAAYVFRCRMEGMEKNKLLHQAVVLRAQEEHFDLEQPSSDGNYLQMEYVPGELICTRMSGLRVPRCYHLVGQTSFMSIPGYRIASVLRQYLDLNGSHEQLLQRSIDFAEAVIRACGQGRIFAQHFAHARADLTTHLEEVAAQRKKEIAAATTAAGTAAGVMLCTVQ